VLASKDYTNSIGLRELLEKLIFEGGDDSKGKDIRKYYENLMSMHDETPEIDYNRLESIKSYFNVFENKLSQAGPLLIALHQSTAAVASKEANPHAQLETLANLTPNAVKKLAKSASFSSVRPPPPRTTRGRST
jgi:U3 small nucleolar ribonucleoprotein component